MKEAPDRPSRHRLPAVPLPSQLPSPVSIAVGQLSLGSSSRPKVERISEGDEDMEERRTSSDGTSKLCGCACF